jgi:4-azaleucine resistance transporter AzlC
MRAELPLMLGVAPFGLIFGALAAQLGVPTSIAQAMSSIIFGGSSQFIAAPLIVTATPPLVLVLTVFVVNLRHALYSASVAPYLERLSPLWKGLLAYLLTDEAYVVAIAHFHAPGSRAAHVDVPDERHWFLLGAGVTLWVFWQMSTAVGVLVGTQVPKEWSLDFALPLTFIALVMPMLRSRAYVAAAVSAGAVGLLTFGLPYKLGLVLAAVFGIVVGMVVEAWTNRQRRHTAGGGGRGVRT